MRKGIFLALVAAGLWDWHRLRRRLPWKVLLRNSSVRSVLACGWVMFWSWPCSNLWPCSM